MNRLYIRALFLFLFLCAQFLCASVRAQIGPYLDTMGVTLLRAFGTNLNGAGIRIGQPEADYTSTNDWEVDPPNVAQPVSLFTYYTNGATSTMFPNTLGVDSAHADNVGQCLYDFYTGAATNVAHVDNAFADDYYNDYISQNKLLPVNVTDAVVSQSFTFGGVGAGTQETIDSAYDNYSVQYKTLFVSAACNYSINPTVSPPGTSYNCISVGAYLGDSSYGPTIDNGRCKPDMVAVTPTGWNETSFSTPLVAAAAAIMMQAGLRGDGGKDTNSAANMITVKALLLNGAVKPANWKHTPPEPLDTNYGVGVLNVFNSYEQLAGGKHNDNFSTNIPAGTAHPPVSTTASMAVLNGWDFNTNTSSATQDGVNHYFFNITNNTTNVTFTLTATLNWNRHQNTTGINNLALYLYNAANSNLVASSTSVVDNVQHVYLPKLAQGRYDLQVWKAGGAAIVSDSEPYALAWGIFTESLSIGRSGTNIFLSWPAYPAGFAVEGITDLNTPIGSTNNIPSPVFTNNQNVVWLSPTNNQQFFWLQTPNF
jgi:hypothetical protein